MLQLSNIISYFNDCYRSDNRELVIYDFLDRKIENRIVFEDKEELINGAYPIVPIDSKKASALIKKIELFEKEKELLYGAFFIAGQYIDFRGHTQQLCSPLFYYPASIEYRDDFHYLSLRLDERRINHPLINLLSKEMDGDFLSDPLYKDIPHDLLRFEDVGRLAELCKKHFKDITIDNIFSFPNNSNLGQVKRQIKKYSDNDLSSTVLIPTSILGLVNKSINTRGVLNELNELSQLEHHSQPLKTLFNLNPNKTTQVYKQGFTPIILSSAQQQLVESSSTNPLTLIVGPPGTGKSYTIGSIALEHMSRGESVLIASRTDEAVDVILSKIKKQIGTDKFIIRGGKKRSYTTPLNQFLKALLNNVNPFWVLRRELKLNKSLKESDLELRIKELEKQVKVHQKEINLLESTFEEELANELKWGEHLSKKSKSLWNSFKTEYLNFRNKWQTPIWEDAQKLQLKDKEQCEQIKEFILLKYSDRVLQALKNDWQSIKTFRETIRMASDTERIKKFEEINFKSILKTFPIWMTNLSEIKNNIPFEQDLFDVAIIDEATQCDIASCLPILQRAKRVVFAGDPNQLRHISFLSKGIQASYQSKHRLETTQKFLLNYRKNSVLDLAINALTSKEQVATLDEHFRSIQPIISFSNTHFYDDNLHIMNSRPDADEKGVYIHLTKGTRHKNGTNGVELETLMQDVKNLITNEKDSQIATSIGILDSRGFRYYSYRRYSKTSNSCGYGL